MTSKTLVEKFISTHSISDNNLKEWIARRLYLIASKHIPVAIDNLNREISDLRHLEKLLINEWYKIEKDNDSCVK